MKKVYITITLILFGFSAHSQARFITTSDGVDLYVNIRGQGTPVLYLHGGPGSGSYWVEKHFGEELEKNYQMIYLDQRGVGRSKSPTDKNYSMERMALDFEEIRKELGYDSWLTFGHSFGGILQMGYYQYYPQSIKGMIMVNVTLDLNESFCTSWSPKAAEFLEIEIPGCENDTIPLMDRMQSHIYQLREKDLFWKMAYEEKKYDSIMDATYQEIPDWNGDFGNVAFSKEEFWKNYKPSTSQVKVPVLFFYGKKDWMVGPEHYKGMKFPELMLWENEGGHIPFYENQQDLSMALKSYSTRYNF